MVGLEKIAKIPLSFRIILGMLLGIAVGPFLGSYAHAFGEIGKLVIQLIKIVAAPLLFFAILNAIVKTDVTWKQGGRMMLIATFNACVALTVGLLISNYFKPGEHMKFEGMNLGASDADAKAQVGLDFMKTFASYIPQSIVHPFYENMILSIVLLALFFGFALRRVSRIEKLSAVVTPSGTELLERIIESLQLCLEVILSWVIQLIPLAVFGVVAKSMAEYGLAPFRGLAAYVGAGLLGFAIHVFIYYQFLIRFVIKMPLKKFWAEAKSVVIYALGTNSSLATLPLTLKALDKLKISRASSTLGACVGTNFNNDGIILYEAMAVLLVAQAHGIHLGFAQQLLVAVSCLVAAIGIAGVPESGFISLSIVLVTVGLPTEILPLLLTVDWVLARGRSGVNVLSDMIVSMLIEKTTPLSTTANDTA